MPLSCRANTPRGPRLPGTCSQYSKKAMPQLTRTSVISGPDFNFRWPYQATVMKTLLATSSTGYSQAVIGMPYIGR